MCFTNVMSSFVHFFTTSIIISFLTNIIRTCSIRLNENGHLASRIELFLHWIRTAFRHRHHSSIILPLSSSPFSKNIIRTCSIDLMNQTDTLLFAFDLVYETIAIRISKIQTTAWILFKNFKILENRSHTFWITSTRGGSERPEGFWPIYQPCLSTLGGARHMADEVALPITASSPRASKLQSISYTSMGGSTRQDGGIHKPMCTQAVLANRRKALLPIIFVSLHLTYSFLHSSFFHFMESSWKL